MAPIDAIPLPKLAGTIAAEYGRSPSYRHLYLAVLNGQIPAQHNQSGRISVRRQDLPRIAAHFGLVPQAA